MAPETHPDTRRGPDWNARYAAVEGGLFGEAPSPGLVMALARLRAAGPAPRSAVLIADGDGRNGSWLAREGLDVTATDLSEEATRRAEARDRAAGVAVARRAEDVMAAPPPAPADLSALIYLQGPERLRRRALASAAAATAPGGALFLEGFSGEGGGGPGPADPALRWSVAEALGWLAEDAPDLSPEEAVDGLVRLDEGPKHSGVARVLRLILIRPPEA
ncbi:MAG: hypothetical protein R6V44_13930 [Paracoccaceae bacterium]